jgi:hypothetical protein
MEDSSLKSFLFTIKNPHNLATRIFAQKRQERAIFGSSSYGPVFGAGSDLQIRGDFYGSNSNYSKLGNTYANDTEIAGTTVLTGSQHFRVKEIEVFEVKGPA